MKSEYEKTLSIIDRNHDEKVATIIKNANLAITDLMKMDRNINTIM